MTPARMQTLKATAHIPWTIKPLYGLLSDNVPICGLRRKPYLFLFSATGAVAYLLLAWPAATAGSALCATAWLFLSNFSTAATDVVIDARVVEEARKEPASGAGDLQSLSWTALSIGGFLGTALGGVAYTRWGPSPIFVLSAIMPLVVACLAPLMREDKETNAQGKGNDNGKGKGGRKGGRRRRGKKGKGRGRAPTRCAGVRAQLRLLWRAVRNPLIWKPSLWVFLSQAMGIGLWDVFFFYYTGCDPETNQPAANATAAAGAEAAADGMPACCAADVAQQQSAEGGSGLRWYEAGPPRADPTCPLAFDAEFLSLLGVVGYLALAGGTVVYNARLKQLPFRTVFFWAQAAYALCTSTDLLLVTGFNRRVGIPDKAFMFAGEVLTDVVGRFKSMPQLVLAAKLCPPGIEGTLFALLMSVSNGSYDVAGYLGAAAASWAGVGKDNFDNLWLLVAVRTVGMLVPLVLLPALVPAFDPQELIAKSMEDVEGSSSSGESDGGEEGGEDDGDEDEDDGDLELAPLTSNRR